MIASKRVLALVVARGGSKGLPRKNLRPLAGKPLIAWSFDSARGSAYIDRIVLSTEDEEIAALASAEEGVETLARPSALAGDEVGLMPVVLHAIDALDEHFDYLVLLQPTSPLRRVTDIDRCLELCERRPAPACVTLVEQKPASWMFTLTASGVIRPLLAGSEVATRRQDEAPIYCPNGAVYVAEREWLRKNGGFFSPETIGCPMPRDRSVDIDDEIDFRLAEVMLNRGVNDD